MRAPIVSRFILALYLPALFGIEAAAQVYPDTLWVPVIFYDYWVDNSLTNPDFESANASNTMEMVQKTLDAQRKPVTGPNACPQYYPNPPMACHLSEWFRVSGVGGSDASCLFKCDSTNPFKRRWYWTTAAGAPLPNYLGRPGEFVGPGYDSAYDMRNVIIYDSLPFIHLGRDNPGDPALQGVYQYDNNEFFMLDNKGFGNQPERSEHNFGFTMELHTTFKYRKGLTFSFTGDDDAWAFVNNQLIVDLGGRHAAANGSFSLDDMTAIPADSICTLDFFYAERHTSASEIRITSDIISIAPFKRLSLKAVPGDTLTAGDTMRVIGTVYDKKGNRLPSASDSIMWSVVPGSLQAGDAMIGSSRNDSIAFTATQPFHRVGIIGSYKDSAQILTDTVWVTVVPAVRHLVLKVTSGDTLHAGDTARIIGTILDNKNKPVPALSNLIQWSIVPSSSKANDRLTGVSPNDTMGFTATQAFHRAGIVATFGDSAGTMVDTIWIVVVPGPADQIDIVRQSTTPLAAAQVAGTVDLLTASPPLAMTLDSLFSPVYLYAVVRDRFGNYIGFADKAAWRSVHPDTAAATGTAQKLYEGVVARALYAYKGGTAIIVSQPNVRKPDTAFAVLVPLAPKAVLAIAITQDADGNGYLDHILISFDKKINLAASARPAFLVRGNGVVFPVDSILKINDSTYLLRLREVQNTPSLQTSWKPAVSISSVPGVADVRDFPSTDGAPPVVWTVVKNIVNSDDRTHDTVTIVLSEKITGTDGTPFGVLTPPPVTFYAWSWNGSAYVRVDSMLAGIGSFAKVNDSVFVFTMSNGHDLTSDNFINIVSAGRVLRDRSANYPTDANRKVRVVVKNPPQTVQAYPNPTRATAAHGQLSGPLSVQHEPDALTWASAEKAGVVIALKNVPMPPVGTVQGTVKIYDIVGNSVIWGDNPNVGLRLPKKAVASQLYIYWNGINFSGMKVAPGIYRVVVSLIYPKESGIQDVRYALNLGFRP